MDTLNYILEKYNLTLPEGNQPVEIPGVGRLDIIRWIRELDLQTGAEIGVYKAEFSRLICLSNPQLKLYGVDPWIEHSQYRELKGQNLDEIYQEAVGKMRPSIKKGKYIVVRKTSMEALADFPDESLDFVYIDANHEAPFVQDDIEGWAKKVRPGGLVTGHDYIRVKPLDYAIIDALRDYTEKNHIQLFVLGKRAVEPGVIRDRVRSWMFIK